MSLEADYLGAFEEHSPEGIRAALAAGASPTQHIKGKTPINCLIEGYLRSPQFAACLRVLIDAGAKIDDPLLEVLLLDDDAGLRRLLNTSGSDMARKLHAPCAFTSCVGITGRGRGRSGGAAKRLGVGRRFRLGDTDLGRNSDLVCAVRPLLAVSSP